MQEEIELVTPTGMIDMLNELGLGLKQSFLSSGDLGDIWGRAVELSKDSIGDPPYVRRGPCVDVVGKSPLLTADRLLTGAEAAQALGIGGKVPSEGVRWLYRTGKLAACKVNGRLKYKPEDLRALIEKGRVGTSKEASALAYQYTKGRHTARRRKI